MTLVIAYGNPLRQDDGVAWQVAEWLRATEQPGLEVITCHQLTPELAEPSARADRIIFVDASEGAPPGRIQSQRVAPSSDAAAALSHHLSPATLIALADTLYGRSTDAWSVTVGGEHFGHGAKLSPLVDRSVPAAGLQVIRLARSPAIDPEF